jgi:phospholipid-binding lipoprotein MlaA
MGLSALAALAALWAAAGARAQEEAIEPSAEATAEAAEEEDLAPPADEASADGAGQISDPFEGFNRAMYSVNNVFDENLLVPVAKGYRAVTPKDLRKGLRNFLDNAETPGVLVNDILQGKPERAGETVARFVINSTFGVAGFVDVAAKWGIPPHSEDFGQTFAVWGVGSGPYLYLPVFGPSSLRDSVGRVFDIAADPLFWIRTNPAKYARYSRFGATAIAFREPFIEPVDDIKAKSLDPYASFRSFYVQSREREIRDGVENYEELPDIGAFEEMDEVE